ncbi:hypothetical protein RRG08_032386 [Elysia crispata]|uniref:Uncharacterized protein n=1 Tax=Elysia crispata TaxID=231223 RepID=A0AAE1AGK2_9GAST|nr:hypothetical protein RRG08_032386 [Elysia crispata]
MFSINHEAAIELCRECLMNVNDRHDFVFASPPPQNDLVAGTTSLVKMKPLTAEQRRKLLSDLHELNKPDLMGASATKTPRRLNQRALFPAT